MLRFGVLLAFILSIFSSALAIDGVCGAELEEFRAYASSIFPDYWARGFSKNNQLFDDYVIKFSDAMKSCGSYFQYISVGACDGTSDSMIQAFYDRSHWNAVFVEASPPNVEALNAKIIEKQILDRSYVLHVAAMEYCKAPTVDFARPIGFDEKKAKHWLRRQIGRVPEGDNAVEYFKKNSKKWAVDTVPCRTGNEIIAEWERNSPIPTKTPGITHRAHLLKIDVEGASFGVLKSFLSDTFPVNELPLFVMAEIKTAPGELNTMCKDAQDIFEKRGYVVSHCGQDLFAMLKPENILL